MNEFTFSGYAKGFDDHIQKSIPGYGELQAIILHLSGAYIPSTNGKMLDVGSSSGRLLRDLGNLYPSAGRYSVEPETKFLQEHPTNYVGVHNFRSVEEITDRQYHFISCIFTLQFIDPRKRVLNLNKLLECMEEYGALILAEKIIMEDSRVHALMCSHQLQLKRSCFSDTDILDKESSLSRIMKCWSEEEYRSLIESLGFKMDTVWQVGLFKAWVIRR